jgi:hypothetical protein
LANVVDSWMIYIQHRYLSMTLTNQRFLCHLSLYAVVKIVIS